MIKRFLILLILSILTAGRSNSQTINPDDRLRGIVSQYGQAEVSVPYTDQKTLEFLTIHVSILSVKDKIVYLSLSKITVEWFIQQKFHYQIIEKTQNKSLDVSATKRAFAADWSQYPSYTQYDSIMQDFQRRYPSLCSLDTIGQSINGKQIFALKITSNNKTKPSAFYTSTIHGDETGGFILMLHLADYLFKNYNNNPRVKRLVDSLEIWINPLANPDGTYRAGNTITTPIRYNANGYDLNRNFPDPFLSGMVSQKETADMIKFLRKHNFALSANFHSGTEVVNYPWDRWLSKIHADDSWFNSISRAYADTVHKYSSPAYMNFMHNGVTRGAVWYVIYGGRQDFVTQELHGREVTIELDDQYVTPEAQLTLLWQNNFHSLLGYLENALYGIHGTVINAVTHSPVAAQVFIYGHDKDSSQVFSDAVTGNFLRMLSPGLWNLTFTSPGYFPVAIKDVNVSQEQRTNLFIELTNNILDAIDTPLSKQTVVLYPNPASNFIKALLPDNIDGNLNVRIVNQTGMILSDYNTSVVPDIPVDIDLKRLSGGIYTLVLTHLTTGSSFHGRFVVIK